MSNKLRVGVVGCGGVAQIAHIPAFLRLKNVVLQAVCDKNKKLGKETTGKFHIPKAYSELTEMLLAESLDIVDICTPPQIHATLAMEALQHGCHVLIEKPMALKTSDCEEMLNASLHNNVKLCIVHNHLFNPAFLKARRLVAEGAIGDFIGMRLFHSDHREEMIMKKDYWIHKLPGGLIGETGPHPVYMSLAFLNKVKNVDIYAKNFLEHPWAPFDEFRIELEGEKAMSSITISYASNHGDMLVDILGTEGVLHLDLGSRLLVHYKGKLSWGSVPFARYLSGISQVIGGITANVFKFAMGKLSSGHDIIIERFVDSIIHDHQSPITGEEGRETVRVMEMIVKRLHEKYGTR